MPKSGLHASLVNFLLCHSIEVGHFLVGNLGNEALIVTRDDEVFALGSNGAGCLGLGDMHSTLAPKQVEPLCYKVRTFL